VRENILDIKLSICIPIYNNVGLFRHCLQAIANSIREFDKSVEIVISDNVSEDNILDCVNQFKSQNKNIKLLYSCNETNKGIAYNFHKVVELARGEFCWIIGSDDFVLKNGISDIIKIIKEYPEIDFISVAYAHLKLPEACDESNSIDPYHRILEVIEEGSLVTYKSISKTSGRVESWDKLVDLSYGNVMLGAVMSGVFRKSLWLSVNTENMDKTPAFNNVENMYPFCAVYAKCMIGKPAYYLSKPVIVAGDGARAWVGEEFWDGSLPIIYLKVLNEIIDAYKEGGLEKRQVIKCRVGIAHTVGRYFYPYFRRKYILKRDIKNSKYICLRTIYKKVWYTPTFYIGLLKGIKREYFVKEPKI